MFSPEYTSHSHTKRSLLIGLGVSAAAVVAAVLSVCSGLFTPGIASYIEYFTRPTEIRARRFAKLYGQDPRWQNIVTLEPRS